MPFFNILSLSGPLQEFCHGPGQALFKELQSVMKHSLKKFISGFGGAQIGDKRQSPLRARPGCLRSNQAVGFITSLGYGMAIFARARADLAAQLRLGSSIEISARESVKNRHDMAQTGDKTHDLNQAARSGPGWSVCFITNLGHNMAILARTRADLAAQLRLCSSIVISALARIKIVMTWPRLVIKHGSSWTRSGSLVQAVCFITSLGHVIAIFAWARADLAA